MPVRIKRLIQKVISRYKASGERGAALVMALMFLLILTLLGMASIMTSNTEMLISRNDRLNKQALNYANAGMQAGMCKLDKGDVGSNLRARDVMTTPGEKTKSWTFYASDVGITDMHFKVTVVYKFEDEIHHDSDGNNNDGEIVSYSRDENYPKSPYASFNYALPVFEITSTGWVGGTATDPNSGTAATTVVVDVTKNTINVQAPGGLFSGTCPTMNGQPTVQGNGSTGVVLNPGVTACDTTGSGWNNVSSPKSGASSSFINMTSYLGINLSEIPSIATEKFNITSNITDTNPTWGGGPYPNNPQIVYTTVQSGKNYKINGITGYGVLVVNGDLEMDGNCLWYGLIYVTGNLTFGGGGSNSINIIGSAMAGGSTNTLSGGVNIQYNQGVLDSIGTNAFMTKIINWQRQYN